MGLNRLRIDNDAQLLSAIVNQMNVDPAVAGKLPLPEQGTPDEVRSSIQNIGKLILKDQRYKNAFINAINVIGLIMVNRNAWDDPWEEFTNRGTMNFGDSAVEMSVDIASVFDYNATSNDPIAFLSHVVPNVYTYIHRINYQKYYKATTSDAQMAMAFNREGGLISLVDEIIQSLFEGYKYDKYLVNKYMLCRRILDGTITPHYIANYASLTPRQRATEIKNVSSLMTFRSPNYNPAGIRIATPFTKQIAIVDTAYDAELETDVYATSFFLDSARMKPRLALIDGFNNQDIARLQEIFDMGDGNTFVPFTSDELSALANVIGCIIDDEWFQNYNYALDYDAEPFDNGSRGDGTKMTEFYDPQSLKHTMWLHYWGIKSTSPYKQAVVFSKSEPAVSSVSVSPSSASVTQGSELQLTAVVATTGFANKSVLWSVDDTSKQAGVTIDTTGKLRIPISATINSITATATSIFDKTKTGTATISVSGLIVAPSTSADLYGKTAIDLQSNLQIVGDTIYGVSKYVTGYTGFSGDPAEQSGNYIALHVSATSGDTTIQTIDGLNDGRSVTIAYTGDDLVVKVVSGAEKLVMTNNGVTRIFNLSGLTLQSE